MRPRAKGTLLLLLAFLLGIAAGMLGFGLYQTRMGWWHPRRDSARFQQFVLKRLTRELDLRPEQQQQVETILRETGQEFSRLREEIGPRVRDIRMLTREKIQAILSPDQQTKFAALEKEWARRHEITSRPGEKESQGP